MNSDTDRAPVGALATAVDGGETAKGTQATSAESPIGKPWIVTAWYDILFFVATPILLVPVVLWLRLHHAATANVYLAVLTFAAVGHQFPCFLRAYGDRELFHRYRMRFLLAPMLMLGVGFGFALLQLDGLSVILLLAGFWHVLTQQYGFVRIYDAKAGSFERGTIRLDFLMCFFWFGAGVIYSPDRMYQLLDRFYAAGGPLLDATWVNAAQLLWGFLTAVVTTAFVMNYIYQRQQGQAPSLVKLTTMGVGIGLWWYSMVNLHNLLLGVLLFELYHAIQYLALTRYYGGCRVEQGREMRRLARWLFRWGVVGLVIYLVAALLYGLPAFLGAISPTWLEFDASSGMAFRIIYALVAASTLLHFYFDSFIWRIRDDDVRKVLALPSARPDIGKAWPLWEHVPHVLRWSLLLVPVMWIGVLQWRGGEPAEWASINLAEAVPMSWQAHARWGADLLEQGRVNEAVEQLQEAIELRPTTAAPFCDFGRALRQVGRFAEASDQFKQAIEIAPNSAQAHAEYGKTLFGLSETDKGRKHLLRAVELAPENAGIRYDLALAEARSQEFDKALESINVAIALDGSNAAAFNARGNIYWNMKDLGRALDDFNKALTLDPRLVKAYRNRSQVHMASGDVQHAVADLDEAIKLEGQSSRDFVIRGDIFYSLKQFAKARADYAEAILREQSYIEPLQRMITLLTSCPDESYRNPKQAITLAETACKQSGASDPRLVRLAAETCALAGDYEKAIRWQQQAIELVPPDAQGPLRKRLEEFQGTLAKKQNENKNEEGGSGKDETSSDDASPAGVKPEGKQP